MVNKNYQKGRRFEYRVKKHLEDKEYYVIRSAGSKSAFDLVAIPTVDNVSLLSETIFIQCKYGQKITKKERDALVKLERHFWGDLLILVAWAKPNKLITFFNTDGTICNYF